MRALLLLLLIVISLPPFSASAAEIVFNKQAPAVEDEAMIVDARSFDEKELTILKDNFLKRSQDKRRLARLTVATSREALIGALFKLNGHPSYATTLEDIAQNHLPYTPVARIMVFQDKASVTVLRSSSLPDHAVRGLPRNVEIKVGTNAFELIHFNLIEPGPALRPSRYGLHIYLRAEGLVSIKACVQATQMFAKATSIVEGLTVDIRPDAWFMDTPDFPALYPFQAILRPPKELQYNLRSSVGCAYLGDTIPQIQCNGTHFYPERGVLGQVKTAFSTSQKKRRNPGEELHLHC